MPVYSLPPADAYVSGTQPNEDPGSVREVTRKFLSSPSYARDLNNQLRNGLNADPGRNPYPSYRGGPAGDYDLPHTLAAAQGLAPHELLARMVYSEAAQQPQDWGAIIDTVHNRARSGQYPNSIHGVILDPAQFSAFNTVTGYRPGAHGTNSLWQKRPPQELLALAQQSLSPGYQPRHSFLNYYNPDIVTPSWGGPNFRRMGTVHAFGNPYR